MEEFNNMPKEYPIDFVTTWLNDSDPEWQAQEARYSPQKIDDSRICRYNDTNLLHYFFRGVEKFAPWVNKIHLVTCGHYPKWLNLKHPKLNFVKHIDYMPQEYLPTFNTYSIQFNFHRIKDLAENFVLFNDDMFLLNKIKAKDFFIDDTPCDQALMRNMTPNGSYFGKILFNNISVINKHFKKHDVIKRNFFKWFNLNYGIRSCFINWQNYRQIKFSDFFNTHLPIAYKKSEFEYVWKIENELLHKACLHKFRNPEDVSDWLIRYFRIVKGEFKPYPIFGKCFLNSNTVQICNDIKKQAYKMICMNDCDMEPELFKAIMNSISEAFETILPEKCSFEV
jgi:hypothetical protein